MDQHKNQEFEVTDTRIVSIVDDDESVRAAIEDLMCSLGFDVHVFESAEDFLHSSVMDRTACLITDLRMPGASGQDLQYHLLAEGHAPPMIFITAFPEKNVCDRVLAKGALACLEKPFDPETLIGLVRHAMATQH